jgi:hypothetical protein
MMVPLSAPVGGNAVPVGYGSPVLLRKTALSVPI